jgi:hypothetical protein
MTNVFHWWQGIVAAGAGVVAMSMLMQMGKQMGITTMDPPTVLGSMFRGDREGAKALGTVLHVMNGLAFGLAYGRSGGRLGSATSRSRAPGGSD